MKKLLLISFSLLLFISCEDSPSSPQKDLLVGSWIFESGTKNGSEEGIELLNNLIFTFTTEQFKCELLPDMMPGLKKEEHYELKDNLIVINPNFDLEIKEVNSDHLWIKFEILFDEEPIEFDLKFIPHEAQ
ncbi:hypothetical protein [Aureispira anguillae]|uniref:Lipocalin-like domain-containing protein n=1 Tax=Aureispira anguillae TaxID=2864201 RepID=A0A915YBK4_9BACT|nr:hypothetical protein [Aureispira anguillae]BDS10054.1 hypothetical protein AsAng_0007590 [Aureispira anguillae]